jgi:adenine deaminase
MQSNYKISGKIVDVVKQEIFQGTIEINNGIITSIHHEETNNDQFIIPGLIDSHIHIESSMLIPSEFAKLAVVHGTVATVSDPHEIANVLGIKGVEFMIQNGNKVPFKFYFGAPSCVPATAFETSGAKLGANEIEQLLSRKEIKYLSEMMNFPGVLYDDKEVMEKLDIAKKNNKPVDGHAPGLLGEQAKKYVTAGISTDHECFTIEEALDKIKYGMTIQIREGSAAKNFETLIPLINDYSDKIMLCSDDRHPDDLVEGHVNNIIKRAIELGYDPVKVLRVCTYNPVKHYNLEVGLLQEGDAADFAIVDDLKSFKILSTYVNGVKVAENGKSLIQTSHEESPNLFHLEPVSKTDLEVSARGKFIKVQTAFEGQLITEKLIHKAKIENGNVVCDLKNDILKIVVINRYRKGKPSIGFIKNFNLKDGAIASTVAHDSHNVIAIGTNDADLVRAINLLIKTKGGISAVHGQIEEILPLPVAGIMSDQDGYFVANKYAALNRRVKLMGSKLHAPFMTLSFMALLVIPELKISDMGLFDGNTFQFTDLFEN